MATSNKKDFELSWSEAIASIDLTETFYVWKENEDEARYKVINIASDFYNPEQKVVTFYDLLDRNGTVHFMKLSQFNEEFTAIKA